MDKDEEIEIEKWAIMCIFGYMSFCPKCNCNVSDTQSIEQSEIKIKRVICLNCGFYCDAKISIDDIEYKKV